MAFLHADIPDPRQDRHSLLGFFTKVGIYLPPEIVDQIAGYIFDNHFLAPRRRRVPMVHSGLEPYNTPPTGEKCYFRKLPAELRAIIFAESLPDPNIKFHPCCDEKPENQLAARPLVDKKGKKTPLGSVLKLMLVNKQACADVAAMLYQRHCFVIHVHEGITKGGIEFLQAGRQPLQFADSIYETRFRKFTSNSQFGFDRLKKINIQIHGTLEKESRHTAINTYFMNLTLCRLLQRGGDKKSCINSITIDFIKPAADDLQQAGRRAIQRAENYWWDLDLKKPRVSSIHNLPDIQLVLSPFMHLSACNHVKINLPAKLSQHRDTVAWVNMLRSSMRSRYPTMLLPDDLERSIETARQAMEDYAHTLHHGRKPAAMDRMTVEDMMIDPDPSEIDSLYDGPVTRSKHKLSRVWDRNSDRLAKRRSLEYGNEGKMPAQDGVSEPMEFAKWLTEGMVAENWTWRPNEASTTSSAMWDAAASGSVVQHHLLAQDQIRQANTSGWSSSGQHGRQRRRGEQNSPAMTLSAADSTLHLPGLSAAPGAVFHMGGGDDEDAATPFRDQ